MICRLRMLSVLVSTVALLVAFCPAGVGRAAPADNAATRSADSPAKPVSPVSVNVTVNVRVSHDTKVDVRVNAPFTPIIGTLQIPDFVQKILGGFFKSPDSPATKAAPKSGSAINAPGSPAAK